MANCFLAPCSVFVHELLCQLHIFLLGLFLTDSLLGVPRVPLGLALEVQHSGAVHVDVAHGGLFVECVNLLQLIVAQGLVHLVVDVVDGRLKIFFQTHDGLDSNVEF